MVTDLLRAAERLDTVEELPEALTIGAERLTVGGELTDLAGLGVHEPQVAGELRVHLLGSQHVDQVDVEPPLEEGAHSRLEPAGIHQVGDDDRESRLARPHRVVAEPVVEARPARRVDAAQELEQVHHLVAPARGRPALSDTLAQHTDADAFHADESDEAERGREARPVLELRRRAEVHGRRGVQEEVEAQVLLVHEELDVEPVEAPVDVPVDVPEVVADPVGAVVAELDAVPAARASDRKSTRLNSSHRTISYAVFCLKEK